MLLGLLDQLGYDPDRAQKRLGDGLHEQRLVREAIAKRTGQRFLDGLTSDEAMFRLYAGHDLSLLAAEDSNYSLYDKKKKGSFGSKQTRRDEVTDVRHVGSAITTGGDLSLVSEGDQRYQGAQLHSGQDLTLDAGGAIAFEAVKDLHQESHEKSKSDLAWTSAKGKGQTDETLRQNQLIAQGDLAIKAADGLRVDLKQIDQQTVSQTIDAMVQADPSLAWLKDLEQRGDVDWRRVQELHDSFKYSHSGLGAGAQLAIAIVVTYLTWGAASAAVGSAASAGTGTAMGAAGTNAAGASIAAGWGNVAATSALTSMATTGTTSVINNKGHLGAALDDTFSSDSLKNYVAAGVSGGVAGTNLGLQLAVNSAMKTVLQGGKFKDNLTQAAIDLAANALTAAIYKKVGDNLTGTGLPTKVAVHAIVGGLIAEAAGGSFETGALAAGANKALIETFGQDLFPGEAHDRVLAMTSQLIGITVAAAAGGSEKDQEKAGWVAQQATLYNHELHRKNAESFAQGVLLACTQKPDLCAPGAKDIRPQDLVQALEVTAAHGDGIEKVNPKALALVNQFLNDFSGTKETLFSPTDSEQGRLEVLEKAELAGAVAGLASTAKTVLKSSGSLLEAMKGFFGSGGAKGSTGAESAINQGRLNSQLLAEEVASGHAFQKHVVERQEFADLGISTKIQFQSFVEKIVSNPAIERRQAVDGTVYYLDSSTKTIVIRGQRGEATAFRPDKGGVGWESYIKSQVPKK